MNRRLLNRHYLRGYLTGKWWVFRRRLREFRKRHICCHEDELWKYARKRRSS